MNRLIASPANSRASLMRTRCLRTWKISIFSGGGTNSSRSAGNLRCVFLTGCFMRVFLSSAAAQFTSVHNRNRSHFKFIADGRSAFSFSSRAIISASRIASFNPSVSLRGTNSSNSLLNRFNVRFESVAVLIGREVLSRSRASQRALLRVSVWSCQSSLMNASMQAGAKL
jgi:hypothetical protein